MENDSGEGRGGEERGGEGNGGEGRGGETLRLYVHTILDSF